MSLRKTNATIAVLRATFNPATKQTSAPAAVPSLGAVPVFMDEIGTALRADGLAPAYDLMMLWDPAYDIRNGDQITGYNPGGSSTPPIFRVDKPASDGVGTSLACRVAMLIALDPAGGSR
jgi:hypothetical protein